MSFKKTIRDVFGNGEKDVTIQLVGPDRRGVQFNLTEANVDSICDALADVLPELDSVPVEITKIKEN
jgi:hypothetical protein